MSDKGSGNGTGYYSPASIAARRAAEGSGGASWMQPPVPPAGTGGNLPPNLMPPPVGTGGNNPPSVQPPQGTGGNLPPNLANVQVTGGNLPPMVRPPLGMGGNLPPIPSAPSAPPVARPIDQTTINGQTAPLQGGFAPVNTVSDTLNQLIDPNGAYMRNAQRRGLEQAAAGGNRSGSSIAAGAASRSALEAAQPLVSEAMNLQRQRENLAFTGEQNQLERNRDYTQAQLQDWVNSQNYNRDFYGALSMMPINSAYQLNGLIQSYALENPDIYTADVISGMSNFFQQNFSQLLSQYFPNFYGANAGNRGGG